MESETFLYYIQGDGLMYTPVFTVTLLLAYLPFILLVVLSLRCYVGKGSFYLLFIRHLLSKLEIVCHYLAKWKTTSHYKIYPVHMAVLLISTISHDLPEVITLYFYLGCPPSLTIIFKVTLT